jgi:DNA-binding XRE family transcriptional regulator
LSVRLAKAGKRAQGSPSRFRVHGYTGAVNSGFNSSQIVSAYTLTVNNTKTVCGELRALRVEMGYSMGEMAQLLSIPKATYQGYETGRRPMPAGFINRIRDWQQIDMEFMAGMNKRIDEHLALDGFDRGIPSEITP